MVRQVGMPIEICQQEFANEVLPMRFCQLGFIKEALPEIVYETAELRNLPHQHGYHSINITRFVDHEPLQITLF